MNSTLADAAVLGEDRGDTPTPVEGVSRRSNTRVSLSQGANPIRPMSGYERLGRSIAPELGIRPEKVVHILNGWEIKYSGSGVSVDDFIYRVEALTHQTLEGDFAVLCRNVSVWFEDKVNEFYWRYHKSVAEVRWDNLCSALRLRFRQNETTST